MDSEEAWTPGTLREMSSEECLERLGTGGVGRVGYLDREGPIVVPIAYVVDHGTVLFRTSPHSNLAQSIRSGRAAFEIDEVDHAMRTGWSVLVRGTAEFVDPSDLPASSEERPTPWPDGIRLLFVRITPRVITGRQVMPG